MSNLTTVKVIPAGVLGFDTSCKVDAHQAMTLHRYGFRYAIRYLTRETVPPDGDLTADELHLLLEAGLAVMAVQHVARPGWVALERLGSIYGRNASRHAAIVGLPLGTGVWLDLEGVSDETTVEEAVAYCNAWFHEVETAGYVGGLYVGSACRLTGDQLYWRLKTKHYWKSGSDVPEVDHRGYCMVQHITQHDEVAGLPICRDVVKQDAFGDAPLAAWREMGPPPAPLPPAPVAQGDADPVEPMA